jgi:hypothetical protein
METTIMLWFIGAAAVLFLISKALDHFIFRKHKTSNVLNALFKHFRVRNEKPIEFRISETKAKMKVREFEVKTMHQKYYTVIIKGLDVLSTETIDSFTLDEDCFMRVRIDPVNLNQFEIAVRES